MNCGHCGTQVPPGYTVCAGCGANYRRNIKFVGIGAIALFACGLLFERGEAGAGIFLLLAGVASIFHGLQRKWYRRNA